MTPSTPELPAVDIGEGIIFPVVLPYVIIEDLGGRRTISFTILLNLTSWKIIPDYWPSWVKPVVLKNLLPRHY